MCHVPGWKGILFREDHRVYFSNFPLGYASSRKNLPKLFNHDWLGLINVDDYCVGSISLGYNSLRLHFAYFTEFQAQYWAPPLDSIAE